jgi:hypothetical protein
VTEKRVPLLSVFDLFHAINKSWRRKAIWSFDSGISFEQDTGT